ncbi:MAG: sensor histidine kinase [Anaerolineae bacterium]|nr:MAG: sensor histidine kinase [Anaerolineae bacterium]
MKADTVSESTWQMSVGLGLQFFASHVVAAAVAIAISEPGRVAVALAVAAVAGMALTLTVQRTLWLINAALDRLKGSRPPAELPPRWHGPLAGLVAQINALMARQREVYDLRESLSSQAQDAAVQQERNRLARELHDSIKQQVFSINMSAAAAQARWEADPQGAQEALSDVRRSAQEAMVEMGALLQQLSPAPLEKVGLVQALRDQCEALGYRTGAKVAAEFGHLPSDDRLPAGAQESLFRITQEAFSNVARHARAGYVHLYMGQGEADGPLTLEIQDDGQGFAADRGKGGMGLENIRQRVRALGGKLVLDSAPGEGTTLRITVPLVETITPSEEAMENHRLNKVFLAGLSGGLALIAVLFYPLYVLVPGRYVDGWPTGSGAVGLGFEIVAALLIVAAGHLAARWAKSGSRQGSTLFGALAGGVAGAVLYLGIGAAVACVVGGAGLLERGLIPAAGKAEVIRLLVEAVVGIVWWSHRAFGAALLVGLGLGAVGGSMASPATGSSDGSDLRLTARTVLTAFAIASAVAVLMAFVKFALLESTLYEGMVRNGLSLEMALPLAGISDWLIGTPVLFYVVSLTALYLLLHAETRKSNDPGRLSAARATAAFLGFVSLAVPLYVGTAAPVSTQSTATVLPTGLMDVTGLAHASPVPSVAAIGARLLIPGLVSSLLLGGLYLTAVNAAYRRQRALNFSPAHPVYDVAVIGILLSPGVMGWALHLARSHSAASQAFGALVALALVIAAVILAVWLGRVSKQSPAYTIVLSRLRCTLSRMAHASLGSAVAIVVPLMTVISVEAGTGLITTKLVEVLLGYESAAREFTLVELVRDLYLDQAGTFLLTFVAATAAIGLLVLVVSGITSLPEQLSARSEVASEPGT